MYYDESGNVIAVVNRDAGVEAEHALKGWLQVYRKQDGFPVSANTVRFVKGRYDFKQLVLWHAIANQFFGRTSLHLTDIDEQNNRLVLEVSEASDVELLSKALTNHGVPFDAFAVQRRDRPRVMATLSDPGIRPTMGGIEIRTAYHTCTHGPVVTFNDTIRGFLVNSHCTPTEFGYDGVFIYQTNGWNKVGREIIDPYDNPYMMSLERCRYSDAALVQYDDSVASDLGAIARTALADPDSGTNVIHSTSPRFRINPFWIPRISIVGLQAHKVGRTTGTTVGAITQTCVTVYTGSLALYCQMIAYGGMGPGDSGAPVYVLDADGPEVDILGIAHRFSPDSLGNSRFVYSDIMGILYDLELCGTNCVHSLEFVPPGP